MGLRGRQEGIEADASSGVAIQPVYGPTLATFEEYKGTQRMHVGYSLTYLCCLSCLHARLPGGAMDFQFQVTH